MNDAPARRDWQTIVLIAFRVVVVIAVAAEVPDFTNTATDRYREIAQAEGTPYRDFPVEYAPGSCSWPCRSVPPPQPSPSLVSRSQPSWGTW